MSSVGIVPPCYADSSMTVVVNCSDPNAFLDSNGAPVQAILSSLAGQAEYNALNPTPTGANSPVALMSGASPAPSPSAANSFASLFSSLGQLATSTYSAVANPPKTSIVTPFGSVTSSSLTSALPLLLLFVVGLFVFLGLRKAK